MNDSLENTNNGATDTVNDEFIQAAQDLGIENELPGSDAEQPVDQEQVIPVEAQIAIGKQMIGGGLILGFNTFGNLNVDKNACEQFAEDLSACICKWYPGGLLAFMEQYKEELAVIYSGSMLFMAIKSAMNEKQAANDSDDEPEPSLEDDSNEEGLNDAA